MRDNPESNVRQMPETETDLLEQFWRAAARDVVSHTDYESLFQARHNYYLSLFAVTGTYDIDRIDAAALNDLYNEGIRLACVQLVIEMPAPASFNNEDWRQMFRATLAGVHQPQFTSLPDSYGELLNHIRSDPKHYYHQHQC
jgi:hypothetical protein